MRSRRKRYAAAYGLAFSAAATCCVAAVFLRTADAQEKTAAPSVAATVNGQPISVGEVQQALETALRGQKPAADSLPQLQAEVLAQLIDRKLVEQALEKEAIRAAPEEVDAAIARLKRQPGQQLTLKGFTETQLRDQVAWQLTWEKYAAKHLTDDRLKAQFDQRRKLYDGSLVRAAHILLRPSRGGDPTEIAALVRQAGRLRDSIVGGKLSFEAAAEKYSAGPSRRAGGDIGFIPRRGLMVDNFADAAFAVEKGQISQPVFTTYGVHLIQVTEVKPGNVAWTEVRDELRGPATQSLFRELAAQHREKAQVRFTGLLPHFRLGTRQLASGADK